MKERDYVNATNLAKLRTIEHVLREVLSGVSEDGIMEIDKDEHAQVSRTVAAWREKLERWIRS